jgi:hypothetical protein
MKIYPIREDDFAQAEASDFSTSADAEPFLLDFGIDPGMFWDEIDWLWDSTADLPASSISRPYRRSKLTGRLPENGEAFDP